MKALTRESDYFTAQLVGGFFVLGLVGILRHVMWRDELNPWLIARDSGSIANLFQNIRYEGHPSLWYLCLYLLNQLSSNPILMQLFHLGLATGSVYLWVRFAPFDRLLKLLFVFGYLPFYEYLLLSRNYALGLLLLFGFCVLYPQRQQGYLRLAGILFLLANTNAFGCLLAIALTATLAMEFLVQQGSWTRFKQPPLWNSLLSLAIVLLGLITALAVMIQPADATLAGGASGWFWQFDLQRLGQTLSRVWNGYIVVLLPNDRTLWEVLLFGLLSLGLIGFSATLLRQKPLALFLYLSGTLILLLFSYVKFLGGPRHNGHFYLLLIVAVWLAGDVTKTSGWGYSNQRTLRDRRGQWQQFVDRHRMDFLTILLICQLLAGLVAFSRDFFIPLSASRETAAYIQSQQLDRLRIMGSRDYAVSPIAGYLNRKLYYPEIQAPGSFVLFTQKRTEVDPDAILLQAQKLLDTKPEPILLILNSELKTRRFGLQIEPLSSFTNSFMSDEKYYLYKLQANLNP